MTLKERLFLTEMKATGIDKEDNIRIISYMNVQCSGYTEIGMRNLFERTSSYSARYSEYKWRTAEGKNPVK